MPPIPAIGYAANAIDDPDMIYFACPIERKGYDWSLIARWDYLEDVAPRYLVPSWEGNKKEKGKWQKKKSATFKEKTQYETLKNLLKSKEKSDKNKSFNMHKFVDSIRTFATNFENSRECVCSWTKISLFS